VKRGATEGGPRRRYLAPEVIQSSGVDCGPAALKCLLEGFGFSASYGRLREACQTEVDGTSIDTLEEVCCELGLDAEQVMLPLDHLLLPKVGALPAILVVTNALGLSHFVVVWRRHGGRVQVMDPARGRRWLSREELFAETHVHTHPVPATAWRQWAGGEGFAAGVEGRLRALGVAAARGEALLAAARADPGWHSLAALDAALRLTASLVESRAVRRGAAAQRLLASLYEAAAEPARATDAVPAGYWMVRPTAGDAATLLLRGAVMVRVKGRTVEPGELHADRLPAELRSVAEERRERPFAEILRCLRQDGFLTPAVWAPVAALVAASVTFEALLLRAFLELGHQLGIGLQRAGAALLLLALAALLWLVQAPVYGGLLRSGRHLETRFRIRFLEKLPRLGDRYFRSRLASDMAERCHSLHLIRELPLLAWGLVRNACELILVTAGVVWLDPGLARLAVPMAVAVVALPFLAQPFLVERELKARSHAGALTRFHLESLLGMIPIRSHGAEAAMQREHGDLLREWVAAGRGLLRLLVGVEAVLSVSGFALAALLLFDHVARHGDSAMSLLVIYWLLRMPVLGRTVAVLAGRYPRYRNIVLRLVEPLGAPEEGVGDLALAHGTPAAGTAARGVALALEGVTVRAAGHTILEDVDLRLEAGEEVAVVGRSGAGKSTLVGLFLGWHGASAGRVLVDGEPFDAARFWQLRRHTAWVDPSVHLWNRSLLDNLLYGRAGSGAAGESAADAAAPLSRAIDASDLRELLERLPQGLQTPLGEGGALVSGGQGQRVRVGRGLLRSAVRLVVLDEAFRGLDRRQRRELLARARLWWRGATLICVAHDVAATDGFDRVVVVERGRLVEQGAPAELAARPGSAYAALLRAEAAQQRLLARRDWRRLRLDDGLLSDPGEAEGSR